MKESLIHRATTSESFQMKMRDSKIFIYFTKIVLKFENMHPLKNPFVLQETELNI